MGFCRIYYGIWLWPKLFHGPWQNVLIFSLMIQKSSVSNIILSNKEELTSIFKELGWFLNLLITYIEWVLPNKLSIKNNIGQFVTPNHLLQLWNMKKYLYMF